MNRRLTMGVRLAALGLGLLLAVGCAPTAGPDAVDMLGQEQQAVLSALNISGAPKGYPLSVAPHRTGW